MNAHIPRSVEELKKLTTQQLMDSMLKWSSEWSEYGDSGAKTSGQRWNHGYGKP